MGVGERHGERLRRAGEFAREVAQRAQLGTDLVEQGLHMRPGLVVLPGRADLGARRMHGPGTGPGNAVAVPEGRWQG